jgi:hypothetical protein
MRSAHSRAGSKFAKLYAHFGLGKKLRMFGSNADTLRDALENIKSGKLGLSVRASTASMNKELEKQNDIMLSQTLTGLYQADAQIIQSLGMQGMPDDLKEYYTEVLRAKQALYKQIVQNFGHDDAARLIPRPALLDKGRSNELNAQSGSRGQQGSPQPGTGGGAPQPDGTQNPSVGNVPTASGQNLSGVPTSNGGSE